MPISSNILQEATGKEVTFYKGYITSSPLKHQNLPNSPVGFSTTSDVEVNVEQPLMDLVAFIHQHMVPHGGNTEKNRVVVY